MAENQSSSTCGQVNTVGGIVHVVSGTLRPGNQPHLFENANIVIDAGAQINADATLGGAAYSVLAMSGTVTGTGAGQLVLAQRLQAVGNGARLNFAPGWLTFGPNGAEFDGYTAFITNVNQIDLPFNTNVTVCGTFDNLAAINIRGIWNQDVRRTRLNNAPNGVINLIHDGGVSSAGILNWGNCAASIAENDGARVVNRGRIVKTGASASRITNNALDVIGGSVEVLTGTLGGDGLSNFNSVYQNASITVAPSATLAHCYPTRVDGTLTAAGGGLVRVVELRGYGAGGDVDMPPGMLVMQSGACAGYTSTGINGVNAPLNIRGAIQNEPSGDLNVYGFVTASPGAQFRMTNQRSLVIYSGALFRARFVSGRARVVSRRCCGAGNRCLARYPGLVWRHSRTRGLCDPRWQQPGRERRDLQPGRRLAHRTMPAGWARHGTLLNWRHRAAWQQVRPRHRRQSIGQWVGESTGCPTELVGTPERALSCHPQPIWTRHHGDRERAVRPLARIACRRSRRSRDNIRAGVLGASGPWALRSQ